MIKFKIIIATLLLMILFAGCSDAKFLGAKKIRGFKGYYVERWFLNPKYKIEIPKGTAFYGAAADKIKDKFIIKYYIAKKDVNSIIEIPKQNMWKIKHNGKRFNKQDDNNLFFYVKTENGLFVKSKQRAIYSDMPLMPIKECYKNGWCKLYPHYRGKIFYVKRSILYKD